MQAWQACKSIFLYKQTSASVGKFCATGATVFLHKIIVHACQVTFATLRTDSWGSSLHVPCPSDLDAFCRITLFIWSTFEGLCLKRLPYGISILESHKALDRVSLGNEMCCSRSIAFPCYVNHCTLLLEPKFSYAITSPTP